MPNPRVSLPREGGDLRSKIISYLEPHGRVRQIFALQLSNYLLCSPYISRLVPLPHPDRYLLLHAAWPMSSPEEEELPRPKLRRIAISNLPNCWRSRRDRATASAGTTKFVSLMTAVRVPSVPSPLPSPSCPAL